MKNEKLVEFKEKMRKMMIEFYEEFDYLDPMLFFYTNDQPCICDIPHDFMVSPETKMGLVNFIRNLCAQPGTLAAGLFMQANAAHLEPGTEMTKLVMNGDVKISELKEKQSLIIMMFSTPESEEMICYHVDEKTRKVGEIFLEDSSPITGIFSGFFSWNKN